MTPKLSYFHLVLALCLTHLASAIDTSLVRESGPLSPEEERRQLKVPVGFEVQLFAAEPQIDKPINMAFDDKGRLWVTSSHEYPYAAARERWVDAEGSRVKDSRDAIIVLEDTDKDGRADKRSVFADGLNVPTGVLPYQNGCIAWSIPNLWFFNDTDGDGVCDERKILFGPLGWEKDVHGNCSSYRLAPDGWVYATHGFSNQSHFKVRPENLKGAKPGDPGTELVLHSGNVFRFKPDGSRVELFSGGQVNPFGLAWDPAGNLYSADCHSAPIYQLLPGALYPSFGKPDDGLGFGPVMMHHTHSSTGICGINYFDRRTWGEAWHDRILIGNVVTSRINCDRVSFRGSTPVASEEPDFLTSGDPWFRPVDLRLGPDRALYVADFYNKIIGHYEVPLEHPGRDKERGRIWRIVKSELPPEAESAPNEIAALRFEARAGRLSEASLEKVRRWLMSADPFEKRVAVEALLRPVSVDWLPDLMTALSTTAADDEALRHQCRIVIREHLKLPGAFAKIDGAGLSAEVAGELSKIARAVNSPEAARYLIGRLRSEAQDLPELVKSLASLATQLPAGELVAFARERYPADPAAQADLLAAISDGVGQRGELPGPELTSWGIELAALLLEATNASGRDERLGRLALMLKYAAPAGLRDRLAAYLPAPAPPPPSPVTPEMRAELDKRILDRTTAFQSSAADKSRGPAIFAAYCAPCHAIGGKGALVGPQLDGIGNRGAARLIEDILDPGRNVDAHFRMHLITKKDGSMFAGLERGQVGELLVCVDAAGQEHRLPKAEIAKNEETGLSLMPPGIGQAIPDPDFHALIGWLLDFK